jgi:hypothetical protein
MRGILSNHSHVALAGIRDRPRDSSIRVRNFDIVANVVTVAFFTFKISDSI